MTTEQLKAWLLEYMPLKLETENRREHLKRLKACAELPPAREYDGSQHTRSSGERMALAVERYTEYEKEIRPYIAANEHRMQAIRAAISAIPDPMEREVLRLRYTDGDCYRPLPWKEVAVNLYGGCAQRHVDATNRLHRKALAHLSQQITEAPQHE